MLNIVIEYRWGVMYNALGFRLLSAVDSAAGIEIG
jgi:hypothetical protein